MKIAVMQPYLFPYIGYFQLMNAVDKFVVLDDVKFINKGWINRNNILVNKEKYLFTMPLKKSSQNKLIRDMEIDGAEKWKTGFLKTIETSYKKSKHFRETFELISDILKNPETNISAFITSSLIEIMSFLNMRSVLIESSSVYLNSNLKGQDRIIDICLKEKATQYYNLPGGIELYSADDFIANGLELKFLKPGKITYKQFDNRFTESLSIIDVLMFNPKEKVMECLNEYELV